VRVEHTQDIAKMPRAGFEDREDHRIPCASAFSLNNLQHWRLQAQRMHLRPEYLAFEKLQTAE